MSNPTTLEAAFSATYVPARKRGFFARVLDVLTTARVRQAERDAARYLAESGGKFTDESEREIERRFLAPTGRF